MLNCRFVVDVGSDFDLLNFAPFRLPYRNKFLNFKWENGDTKKDTEKCQNFEIVYFQHNIHNLETYRIQRCQPLETQNRETVSFLLPPRKIDPAPNGNDLGHYMKSYMMYIP